MLCLNFERFTLSHGSLQSWVFKGINGLEFIRNSLYCIGQQTSTAGEEGLNEFLADYNNCLFIPPFLIILEHLNIILLLKH